MLTMLDSTDFELPPIPSKRYFAIGEVSKLCALKPHVLRYWEQEFAELKPVKRRGNRRYYQRHEVELIRQIRTLLYIEGFTISGAKGQLTQMYAPRAESAHVDAREYVVTWLIAELTEVCDILK